MGWDLDHCEVHVAGGGAAPQAPAHGQVYCRPWVENVGALGLGFRVQGSGFRVQGSGCGT